MSKPTKLSELCPTKYLQAADFDGETTYTIRDWQIAKVGMNEEEKGVLFFDETPRGMVINATKREALRDALGNDLEQFVGKKVVLFPAKASLNGRQVDAIGMRIPLNQ